VRAARTVLSGRRAITLAVVFIALAAIRTGAASLASGKVPVLRTTPTCTAFSTGKISALLQSGRMHRVHAFRADIASSCTYYNVSAAQANALSTDDVPWNQIHYVTSLEIGITETTHRLFLVNLGLLRTMASHNGLSFDVVAPRLAVSSSEWFYSGHVGPPKQAPSCQSQTGILYNNWTGPADCVGQPQLKEIDVTAWIPRAKGLGLMVNLGAGGPTGGRLSLSHMIALMQRSVTGQLY
jgi:hypothetical protein